MTMNRRSAFHIVDAANYMSQYMVPIWVYDINNDDIFPVKFEYKAKGYKGLRFSDTFERITFEKIK